MTVEFKDKVKKEAEEDEQRKIFEGCKRGLRRLKGTLDEAKRNLKQAQMVHDNFLQMVSSDPETAAGRFGRPHPDDDD